MESPLANVSVATTTAIASTAPSNAERTGAVTRSRPRSRAKRIPMTADAGSPALEAAPATDPRGEGAWPRRAARRCGAPQSVSAVASAPSRTTRPTNPTMSTVQSNAKPGCGSTWRTGPIGAKGEIATATPTAASDPRTTLPSTGSSPSAAVIDGGAPRARSTSRSPPLERQRAADGLAGDEERSQAGDGAEDPEGDRLGFDGPLDLALGHRGEVEGVGRAPGNDADDLALDGGHVAAPRASTGAR